MPERNRAGGPYQSQQRIFQSSPGCNGRGRHCFGRRPCHRRPGSVGRAGSQSLHSLPASQEIRSPTGRRDIRSGNPGALAAPIETRVHRTAYFAGRPAAQPSPDGRGSR